MVDQRVEARREELRRELEEEKWRAFKQLAPFDVVIGVLFGAIAVGICAVISIGIFWIIVIGGICVAVGVPMATNARHETARERIASIEEELRILPQQEEQKTFF